MLEASPHSKNRDSPNTGTMTCYQESSSLLSISIWHKLGSPSKLARLARTNRSFGAKLCNLPRSNYKNLKNDVGEKRFGWTQAPPSPKLADGPINSNHMLQRGLVVMTHDPSGCSPFPKSLTHMSSIASCLLAARLPCLLASARRLAFRYHLFAVFPGLGRNGILGSPGIGSPGFVNLACHSSSDSVCHLQV